MIKYLIGFILAPSIALAEEVAGDAGTNTLGTAFNDSLATDLITTVQTHPLTALSVIGLWVVQTVIKFFLATTTTKNVWWYKLLEVAAGVIGKVKQPVK